MSSKIKLEKCRLCLKERKNMESIFEYSGPSITFENMINSISNITIMKDGVTNKICILCQKMLKKTFEFKLMIERSDAELQKDNNLTRILFTNIKDVNICIETDEKQNDAKVFQDSFTNKYLKNDESVIHYHNTVITKQIDIDDPHPLCINELYERIKADNKNDSDFEEDDTNEDYDSDNVFKPFSKDVEPKKKRNAGNTMIKNKPIKPVFLEDLRLMRNDLDKHLKTIKSNCPSNKDMRREDICPHCGIVTKDIIRHEQMHTGVKDYRCSICPAGFFKHNELVKHMKTHPQQKMFKCDKCIASFRALSMLKTHQLSHSDERNFICDICKKAYKMKNSLVRHMVTHGKESKKFSCKKCSKSFRTNNQLKHHSRVHTGERPFKCEVCKIAYSYKQDFNQHCLREHGLLLKHRSVHVINEETLARERQLMRDLMLSAHGLQEPDKPINPFDGRQAALAFKEGCKAFDDVNTLKDIQF